MDMFLVKDPDGNEIVLALTDATRHASNPWRAGALEEADINLGKDRVERVVAIKCPSCGKLNEEDSRFCNQCGGQL